LTIALITAPTTFLPTPSARFSTVLNNSVMMMYMDASALATIGSLLTSLRALVGMAKDVNTAEFNEKLIDIQQKVLDLQASFAELQDENNRLKEDNRQLKSAADIEKTVVFHDHACWRQCEVKVSADHDDESLHDEQYELREEGPYCPSCWTDGKLHRAEVISVKNAQVEFCCKRHKDHYYFKGSRKPS
jgi:regulator of replication initiation timing